MAKKNQNNHKYGGLFLVMIGALLLLRDFYPDYNVHDFSSPPLSKGHVPFVTPVIIVILGIIYAIVSRILRYLKNKTNRS